MAKNALTPALTFAPGSGTLNLSGIANFDLRKLMAVLNLTQGGAIVYAPLAGYGITAIAGTTLTLAASLTGMAATDQLMVLYDDGGKPSGPSSAASPGYDTKLLAKVGPCTLVNAQATNSGNVAGYFVVVDAAAVPAVGAAISPLKQRRIGPTPDNVVDAEAEIATPLAITLGLVVLLTTSLTQYQPGALSGQINASFY